jgi:hypothetical protein
VNNNHPTPNHKTTMSKSEQVSEQEIELLNNVIIEKGLNRLGLSAEHFRTTKVYARKIAANTPGIDIKAWDSAWEKMREPRKTIRSKLKKEENKKYDVLLNPTTTTNKSLSSGHYKPEDNDKRDERNLKYINSLIGNMHQKINGLLPGMVLQGLTYKLQTLKEEFEKMYTSWISVKDMNDDCFALDTNMYPYWTGDGSYVQHVVESKYSKDDKGVVSKIEVKVNPHPPDFSYKSPEQEEKELKEEEKKNHKIADESDSKNELLAANSISSLVRSSYTKDFVERIKKGKGKPKQITPAMNMLWEELMAEYAEENRLLEEYQKYAEECGEPIKKKRKSRSSKKRKVGPDGNIDNNSDSD